LGNTKTPPSLTIFKVRLKAISSWIECLLKEKGDEKQEVLLIKGDAYE
jgi:hypothetical protein